MNKNRVKNYLTAILAVLLPLGVVTFFGSIGKLNRRIESSPSYWESIRLTQGEIFQGYIDSLKLQGLDTAGDIMVKKDGTYFIKITDITGVKVIDDMNEFDMKGEREKAEVMVIKACTAKIMLLGAEQNNQVLKNICDQTLKKVRTQ